MSGFIDIHCHILPGLDDGPSEPAESVEMLGIAKSDGTDVIVVTPHITDGVYRNTRPGIEEALVKLDGVHDSGIKLLPGADIRICWNLLQRIESGELPLINNRCYLLLELPHQGIPPLADFERLIGNLKMRGIFPVITHPERNAGFIENADALDKLKRAGALFQITASSITGEWGRAVQKTAYKMLKKGLAAAVATDAHDTKKRPPVLSRAFEAVTKKTGRAEAEALFISNPRRIIHGEPIC